MVMSLENTSLSLMSIKFVKITLANKIVDKKLIKSLPLIFAKEIENLKESQTFQSPLM